MATNTWIDLPAYGNVSWKAPVTNAAALPTTGNVNGDARIDLNTDTIYVWNGTSWIAVATPGPSISIDGLTGDVTASGPGVVTATIANGAVTNAKMANMANNKVKANKSGGSAAPSDLTLSSITETGSSILTISNASNSVVSASNVTIQVAQSSSSVSGYLSSTDWTTFNNKLTLPSLTSGSVIFSNGTTIVQDNVNFFWNDTTNTLGVGIIPPGNNRVQIKAISSGGMSGGLDVSSSNDDATGFMVGMSFEADNTFAVNGFQIEGIDGQALNKSVATSGSVIGFSLFYGADTAVAGNLSNAIGINSQIINVAPNTIDDARHFYATSLSGVGTITNVYAFYADTQATAATNHYGVYISGTTDINYFAGTVGIGKDTPSYKLDVAGDIAVNNLGSSLRVKEGSNATMGTAVLNGASDVVVSTTAVTANSRIFLTQQVAGGTQSGIAFVRTRTAGTSFTIRSVALDTSTVAWIILEPA